MERGRFVGRRDQLALTDEALRLAESGEPQFVVFGGDAGIGKTRLMDHIAERLSESGVRVLRGSCVELGAEGLPLAPFTAILRELRRDGLLADTDALARLLPELSAEGELTGQGRLFELFGALLERLGMDRPTLLLIDDLHWSDRSTRDLLGFLARSLRGARVLALLAYRTPDRRHPLRPFLAELQRLPNVRRLDLPSFTRAETAELIASNTDQVIDRVYRSSGGNALFAEELARTPGAQLPETLRDLLQLQLTALPEAARDLVRLAAAAGRQVSHDLLAEVSALPPNDLMNALRAAADARILVPEGDGYVFRHTLLREAAADDLLPAERILLHRTYAEALESRPAHAAELAHHWYEAGDAERARPALLRAADEAEAVFAHAEHCHMLVRALELTPTDRYPLLERALIAAAWAGENLVMLELTDDALAAAALTADAPTSAGLTADALAAAAPTAEAPTAETDPGRRAMLLGHRGMALYNLGRPGAASAADEAIRTAAGASPLPRAKALDLAAAVLMVDGHPEASLRAANEALRLATELHETDIMANAGATVGTVLGQQGHLAEALEALDEAAALATRDPVRLARVHLNRASVLAELARHNEAAQAARAGLEAANPAGLGRTLGALISLQLARALTTLGHWDEAETTAAEALTLDPPGGFSSMLYALRGEIALRRGDLEAAREHLTLARPLIRDTRQEGLPAARLAAELALAENDLTEARQAVTELLKTKDSWPVLLLSVRLEEPAPLRARAARLPPDPTTAYAAQLKAHLDGTWPEAVQAWDALGDPYYASNARLRAAESAIRAGDRETATDLLRTAAAETHRLGAETLHQEVTLVARAARIDLADKPAPANTAAALGLTDRETEVLRLITAGRSNKQIADELFISPKTASVHVSRILAKLNVATRGEAAATAHRLRLFPG